MDIATKASTMQRFSHRLLLALSASNKGTKLFTRDVIQANVQSKSSLERESYIRPPYGLGLGSYMVLQVIKPLYGIPESGLHWYLTYLVHNLDNLGMKSTQSDPCLLVKRNGEDLEGMIALKVINFLVFVTMPFMRDERDASARFKSKGRNFVRQRDLVFNGMTLRGGEDAEIVATYENIIMGLSRPTDQQSFTSTSPSTIHRCVHKAGFLRTCSTSGAWDRAYNPSRN